jgi:hypothetical protein
MKNNNNNNKNNNNKKTKITNNNSNNSNNNNSNSISFHANNNSGPSCCKNPQPSRREFRHGPGLSSASAASAAGPLHWSMEPPTRHRSAWDDDHQLVSQKAQQIYGRCQNW